MRVNECKIGKFEPGHGELLSGVVLERLGKFQEGYVWKTPECNAVRILSCKYQKPTLASGSKKDIY